MQTYGFNKSIQSTNTFTTGLVSWFEWIHQAILFNESLLHSEKGETTVSFILEVHFYIGFSEIMWFLILTCFIEFSLKQKTFQPSQNYYLREIDQFSFNKLQIFF